MTARKYGFLTVLLLAVATTSFALDAWNLDLQMTVSGFKVSQKPRLVSGNLIFTYKATTTQQNNRIRYVGAAFRNEHFATIHTFQRNDNGVYFLVYPVPKNVSTVEYRLVVDGLWMPDPANPDSVAVPDSDIYLSVANVPQQIGVPPRSPQLLPGNRVEFELNATPGKAIYVAGSFNNWDPFMHRMEEVSPGHYSLTIRVIPGTYYYYYVTDGRRMTDPRNTQSAFRVDGSRVSVFHVNKS
jgi:hypothetical protein